MAPPLQAEEPVATRRTRRSLAEHHTDQLSLEARLALLADVPLFRGLDIEALRPLAAATELLNYAPGDHIVRQGDPGDSIYLIVAGRVQVLARLEREGITTESVVSWLGVGEALGELSLLDGKPRSASCVAMGEVTCLRLHREQFTRAMRRHWSLSQAVLEVLAQRLRAADTRLAEQARDPLTGLYSRRSLSELYEREVARAQRAYVNGDAIGAGMAVLFADVDRFKSINDHYGHQTGDDVLRAVARTLTSATRTSDVVARYGGDEFVVLLLEATEDGAQLVANRVRRDLRERPPGPVPFSVSVGVALADAERPVALQSLLAGADQAMYEQKRRA